jgi:hypothetical protein
VTRCRGLAWYVAPLTDLICLIRMDEYRIRDEAHAAVSPRPPCPSNTTVARAEGNMYVARVWALSL